MKQEFEAYKLDDIETIARNSFKNFQAKGLDYVCLQRSEDLTVKAYFFDGDTSQLPEIVVPHNHRYSFLSRVIAGCVENREYAERKVGSSLGEIYDEFDFYTPLNGGDGFVWVGEVQLQTLWSDKYGPGQNYYSTAHDIHTLQIHADQSILILHQYKDRYPKETPSQAFKRVDLNRTRQKPSLDGLYDEMKADDVRARIEILSRLGVEFKKD